MPHVEPRITIGNIASIVTTLVAGGGILFAGASWYGGQTERVNAIHGMALENRAAISAHETRIRQAEQYSARMDERVLLILDTVREIKAKLDRP